MKGFMRVSKSALMGELNKLGITAAQASQELGFSQSYLSQCFRSGSIPEYTQRLIKFRYNIDPEVYCTPIEKEEPEDVKIDDQEILQELRRIRMGIEALVEIWKGEN